MKTFFFALIFISPVFAQVNFNSLVYNGTGCPQGTVSSVTSPDGSSLSILFDEFRAEVPEYNQRTVSQKSCALSFTATLPPNTRAESLEISLDARGAAILDEGVEGFYTAILVGYKGLANSRGNPTVVATKRWRGNKVVDEAWTETPKSLVPLQSGCSGSQGRDIRIDLKNHVNAEIKNGNLQKRGLITVDSNDVTGLIKFTLRTGPCGRGARLAP